MKKLIRDFKKMNIPKWSYPYGMVLETLEGNKVHTILRTGKFGRTDYTKEVVKIMHNLGVDCVMGNDAPRGGKIGTYVMLDTCSLRRYIIK